MAGSCPHCTAPLPACLPACLPARSVWVTTHLMILHSRRLLHQPGSSALSGATTSSVVLPGAASQKLTGWTGKFL